ncbi:MAG: chemotaxis protein CheX [Pirellulales bacterium]
MVPTEDIIAVTNNVLTTMLQLEALPTEDQEGCATSHRMTGCVQISGAWTGAVVVQTTQEFAGQAACKLLLLEENNVEHNDRQDTLAELTNMIGGNIKSIVPGPSFLSLPSVTTGQDFDFRLFGAGLVNTVSMNCNGEKLRVMLCQGVSSNQDTVA